MALDTLQERAQHRGKGQGDKRDGNRGEDGPEDEGVPLPEPKLAGEFDGAVAGGVEEFCGREGHGRGVEDATPDPDEWNDEDQFERVDDVVAELRCCDIQTEHKRYGQAEQRSAANDRIDADEEACGDAPGELLWRGAHAEESQDRKGDATVGPVVVDGWGRAGEVWFAELHC